MLKLRHLLLLSILCILTLASNGMGQSLTLVRDIVQNPDGTDFNGTLTLTWVGGTGGSIPPTSTSASVISGLFSVLLQPTTTVSPCAYYSATFTSSSGATSYTQQWFVPPSSLPQAIADVLTPNSACANLPNPTTNGFSATLTVTSSLTFATQTAGTTSAAQNATLSSTGYYAVAFTSFTIAGTNASDFAISANTCPTSLNTGSSCTVSVVFKPTAGGARTAQLQIADNVSGSPQIVQLSGTGLAGISVTPSSLTFASQNVGSTSAAQVVTLQNPTTTAYSFTGFALSGTNASDYAISANTCGSTIAGSGSCSVSIAFTPTGPGARTATLQISDNAAGSPQSVTISGTGVGGSLTVTSSLAFGAQGMSTTSAPQTITIQNASAIPVTFVGLALTGNNISDFTVSGNTCGAGLTPGTSCQVSITFSPLLTGTRTAYAQFTDNATNSPQLTTLTGTGATTTLSVPASLTFSSQTVNTSATQQVSIQNTGTVAAAMSTFTLSGTNVGDFAITANTCGATLAAGSSCQVSVTFTPAATGSRSASLQIASSASNSPQNVSLSGTATPASLTVTSSVTFTSEGVGTTSSGQSVVVQNAGAVAISLSGVALAGANPGAFAISSNTCGSSLTAGASCQVIVTFTPPAAGTFTANLQIGNSGTPNPALSALSGTGVAVSLTATSQLTFSSQVINTTSASQTISLQNTGTASAGLSSFTFTGTNSADFAISSNNCGSILLASSSCQINVTFTPQGVGSRSASLQITDTGTNSPQIVTLSGTGQGAALTVTPSLAYGTVTLGTSSTQTVTIQNTGGLVVAFAGLSMAGSNPGDFAVSSSNNCPASLAVGASCQFGVTFAPTASESRSAILQIGNSTSINPISVSLSGIGSVALPLQISQVSSLATQLAQKPNMSSTYTFSSAAWIDGSGNVGSITGNATDCVHVNGSSGACGGTSGNSVSVTFVDAQIPSGTLNGVNATFTLTQAPNPAASLEIFRNGVLQDTPNDYSLSGSTITFTNIPLPADELLAYYRVNGTTQTVNFSDAETPSGLINGINLIFSLAYTPSGGLRIYKNGVLLDGGIDYTLSGSTVTFSNTAIPNTGDILLAYYRH